MDEKDMRDETLDRETVVPERTGAVPQAQATDDTAVRARTEVRSDGESSADGDDSDAGGDDADVDRESLLPDEQSDRFTSRWQEIQASFVDRPQDAVEEADALVADLMQRVTGGLTQERQRLEGQWARGEEVTTEDLRVALTRYRSFFDRLLSA